jgi:hypothetical protein
VTEYDEYVIFSHWTMQGRPCTSQEVGVAAILQPERARAPENAALPLQFPWHALCTLVRVLHPVPFRRSDMSKPLAVSLLSAVAFTAGVLAVRLYPLLAPVSPSPLPDALPGETTLDRLRERGL